MVRMTTRARRLVVMGFGGEREVARVVRMVVVWLGGGERRRRYFPAARMLLSEIGGCEWGVSEKVFLEGGERGKGEGRKYVFVADAVADYGGGFLGVVRGEGGGGFEEN